MLLSSSYLEKANYYHSEAARTQEPGKSGDDMDEEDDEIAHLFILPKGGIAAIGGFLGDITHPYKKLNSAGDRRIRGSTRACFCYPLTIRSRSSRCCHSSSRPESIFLYSTPAPSFRQYAGVADHTVTAMVVRETRLPVIANRDIRSVADGTRDQPGTFRSRLKSLLMTSMPNSSSGTRTSGSIDVPSNRVLVFPSTEVILRDRAAQPRPAFAVFSTESFLAGRPSRVKYSICRGRAKREQTQLRTKE